MEGLFPVHQQEIKLQRGQVLCEVKGKER